MTKLLTKSSRLVGIDRIKPCSLVLQTHSQISYSTCEQSTNLARHKLKAPKGKVIIPRPLWRTRMMVEMLSRCLLSPALLSLGSGRVLSWWFGCLRLFAILWFRVLWASASVVEITAVPTLRWLLTLGFIPLVLFVFFISILSGLSLTRRTPESQAKL